ncbi:MAG: transcription elongation factor GreA [Candidatus Brennerbacteria bacterium]|nr:transcription elongation factor GreA [Candidatus Brennerbacteria bacterium]
MEVTYLSQERHDELQKELEELKTSGRLEVAKRLKQAKELGDLSENSEYQEAKSAQAELERRIGELGELLRNASIIKKSAGAATARIGSQVKLEKDDKSEVSYTIVGSSEARPARGLISNESPLGRAILGRRVGDAVKVATPMGEKGYKVLAIE